MKKYLSVILLLSLIQSAYAEPHYQIIINAEKPNSNLHLFVSDENKDQPTITELFSERSEKSLSSFANDPDKAGDSLKKIIDDAVKQLDQQRVATNLVSISVLGTDGMRLLSKEQQAKIYASVKHYFVMHYDFKVETIKTLSGKMQGVYDWLTVNYLENNFKENSVDDNVIDMGDDSTQIAFLTKDHDHPQNELTVSINHQRYTIFSKSFSRLGEDQSVLQLNKEKSHETCYQTGHYLFNGCQEAFNNVIAKNNVSKQLIPLPQTIFAVISRANETYQFFDVEDATKESLEARIADVCEMSWDQMKQEYADSGIPLQRLFLMCANGIYLDALFYQAYQLTGQTMWVTNKAHNGQEINWTLGAVVYKIITA